MNQDTYESDDELFVDNLSNYSCQSDIEDFSESEDDDSSEEDIIPLPSTFSRRRISTCSDLDDGEEWSSRDNPPALEEFLGRPGINTENVPDSVADAVNLFIDENFFAFLVEESNRYYHQNEDNFKTYKKSLKWKDITVKEMKKFLGLVILMGQVRKDRRDDYWSTEPWMETPFFPKTMSRDRFRQIWRAWHFNNNENVQDNSDRLCKVRPLLDFFLPKFKEVYKPIQQLSLDEGIVPWRGRLFFRVYNAGKIIKYGILVRMVCESNTGYICNFEIYCSEGKRLIETIQTVVSPYTDLWHHVYMDNYYNSVQNSEILLEKKIRICGTIRKNRGLPDCLKMVSLKNGETTFRRKKDILLQVWQSKKTVFLISSIHSAEMRESQNIDRRTRQKIIKPNALIDYNRYMKGVDRADQYLYYSILCKTAKWTKRMAMYLINCALFNSFVVYNSVNSANKKKYQTFLKDIAVHWLTDEISIDESAEPVPSTSRSKGCKSDPPGRLSMDMRKHTLEPLVGTGKNKNVLRRCRVCAAHKLRSETRYMCKFCNVPLHKGKCFERYHTVKHY